MVHNLLFNREKNQQLLNCYLSYRDAKWDVMLYHFLSVNLFINSSKKKIGTMNNHAE